MLVRVKKLLPLEHGSWGLLIIPWLVGTFAGPIHVVAPLLLLTSALGVFLARRPMLHWLRAFNRESLDHITVDWPATELLICFLLFIGGGLPLLMMGRWPLLGVFGLAAFLIWSEVYLAKWRQKFTVVADLGDIFVLCLLAPSAYYVSLGHLDQTAVTLFILCSIYFAVTTTDVRLQIAEIRALRGRENQSTVDNRFREFWITVIICSVILLLLLAQSWIRPVTLLALSPILMRVFGPTVLHVSYPRSIRSLGWREVIYSLGFAIATTLLV